MECVWTLRFLLLINDSPTPEFVASCGDRQEGPLSPFLLCLASKGMSILISRCLKFGALYGMDSVGAKSIHHLNLQMTLLFFFLPNDLQCMLDVKRMLRWFNLCLGLYVNFYKSSLVGMNIDEIFAEGISGVLRCRCDILPIKYLGLSFGSWKGRLLSMTRRVLIKNILSIIPLYYMSIFRIRKAIAQKITVVQSRFLWGGIIDNRKIPNLARESMVKEEDRGGLGVRTILAKNQALLFNWIWKLGFNDKAS